MIKSQTPMTRTELSGRLFVGVPEAARRVFMIDPRSLRAAIAAGEVPAVKIGRKIMIPTAAVLAMLGAEQADGQHTAEAG